MPVTVFTGISDIATRHETQRKVFRNPRGQNYYYAVFIELDAVNYRIALYKSSDGSSWAFSGEVTGHIPAALQSCSVTFYEDDVNSQLVLYFAYMDSGHIYYRRAIIGDAATDPTFDAEVRILTGGAYIQYEKPAIQIDRLGYVYIALCRILILTGGRMPVMIATRQTYPGASPTWSGQLMIGGSIPSSELYLTLAPFLNTRQILVVFHFRSDNVLYMRAREIDWDGASWTYYTVDDFVFRDPASYSTYHSSLSLVVDDSNVGHLVWLQTGTPLYIGHRKWTMGVGWGSETRVHEGAIYQASVVSINRTASPNILCVFYERTNGKVNYKTSPSGSINWGYEQTISDDTILLRSFSSSYQDWNNDNKVQLIYTTQGFPNRLVRFLEVTVQLYPIPRIYGDGLVMVVT